MHDVRGDKPITVGCPSGKANQGFRVRLGTGGACDGGSGRMHGVRLDAGHSVMREHPWIGDKPEANAPLWNS